MIQLVTQFKQEANLTRIICFVLLGLKRRLRLLVALVTINTPEEQFFLTDEFGTEELPRSSYRDATRG
jgi:hypothetical protein|tara:strand:+ start:894 stop:1097 length:204 start_codon:yes stop_codon:yes gene_type:complete